MAAFAIHNLNPYPPRAFHKVVLKKIDLIFIFTLLCGASKGFFFSLSGIGAGRVNSLVNNLQVQHKGQTFLIRSNKIDVYLVYCHIVGKRFLVFQARFKTCLDLTSIKLSFISVLGHRKAHRIVENVKQRKTMV